MRKASHLNSDTVRVLSSTNRDINDPSPIELNFFSIELPLLWKVNRLLFLPLLIVIISTNHKQNEQIGVNFGKQVVFCL